MPHPLEPIVALQKKDRRMIKLMREIRDIPQRKGDIEAQLAGSVQKLEQALAGQKQLEVSLSEIELEIVSDKEQIDQYKNQQMDATTNDQYRAFVKEIGTVETNIKYLEDRELTLMESLERVKKEVASSQERLDSERAEIADELNELDERSIELKEQLDSMKTSRQRNTANIDKDILQKYTRIMNNKRDFAVVFIEPGGHCGGCHMKLPPQVINDARNPTKIVACNFCGRIVYNPREGE